MTSKFKLVLYTKTNCPLCDEAKGVLHEVQREIPFFLEERYRAGSRRLGGVPPADPRRRTATEKPSFTAKYPPTGCGRSSGRRRPEPPALTPRYKAFLRRLRDMLAKP